MKKILLALFLLFGLSVSSVYASTYSSNVLSTNPFTYWRMNDVGPSTTVVDSSTTGNNGTIATPPTPIFGLDGGVYNDSTSKAIQAGSIRGYLSTSFQATGVSYSIYTYSSCGTSQGQGALGGIDINTSSGLLQNYSINVDNACNVFIYSEDTESTPSETHFACGTLSNNTWTVIGFADTGAGSIYCYKNGILQSVGGGSRHIAGYAITFWDMWANSSEYGGSSIMKTPMSEAIGWNKYLTGAQMASVQIAHPASVSRNYLFLGAW